MSADFGNKQYGGPAKAPDDLSYCRPMDVTRNFEGDRFELLSAYLDGEVTAAERRQVEQWLEQDPVMQQLHRRLLSLRQNMQSLATVPAPTCPSEQMARQVMHRLDRRPRHLAAVGGLTTVAAVFLGAVLLPMLRVPAPQYATAPMPTPIPQAGLRIALDSPVIEIPQVLPPTGMTNQ